MVLSRLNSSSLAIYCDTSSIVLLRWFCCCCCCEADMKWAEVLGIREDTSVMDEELRLLERFIVSESSRTRRPAEFLVLMAVVLLGRFC